MQPINYMLDMGDPFASVQRGLQAGISTREKQEQKIAAARANEAMQADMNSILGSPNPRASDYAALITKYPQMSAPLKDAWSLLDEDNQQNQLTQTSEVYNALQSGNTKVAQDLLEEQAQAYENSGDPQEAKAARTISSLIESSPEDGLKMVGIGLASLMGPEKFTETFTGLENSRRQADLEESGITAAQSKARKAAVEADFAESNAIADLEKKGWEVFKIQEDASIARENQKIAAINAQINRTTNEQKQRELELKKQEMLAEREEKVRGKTAEVESSRIAMDNMLNSLSEVLNVDEGVLERNLGAFDSSIFSPTILDDSTDFKALMENIDAQAFVAQIPNMKGLGALSDSEGKKLAGALRSFSLKQSPERFRKNIEETVRLINKMRSNLTTRYGVPDTIPDTPEAQPSPEEINSLVEQYTRPTGRNRGR